MNKGTTSHFVHLIGFGSQGRAWAENLRDAGWVVRIYLSRESSPSWVRAQDLGFAVSTVETLQTVLAAATPQEQPPLIAFLCPDHLIGGLYAEFLQDLPTALTLVLAHGYSVYSGQLNPRAPQHQTALLAPKAIGPQLRKAYIEAKAAGLAHHTLAAGFTAGAPENLKALASALGFAPPNLIATTPETEARGDLISEQGLLCGGLFTLIDWTIQAMNQAGIPSALTREECITELTLIAGLIKERGLETTLRSISQAALAGAATMNQALEESGVKERFMVQLSRVDSGEFARDFDAGLWRPRAEALARRFRNHDQSFATSSASIEVQTKSSRNTDFPDTNPDPQLERPL